MALEFEYLTALTRSYVQAEHPVSEPPSQLDWSVFTELCSFHKVSGTLLPMIPSTHLSASTQTELAEAQALPTETAALNLMFLERILPHLEKAGCHPIILKGGVLAPLYYEKPEQRYLADLDILVDSHQVDRACEVLQGLGLQFTQAIAHPTYYRDHHFHWIMNNDVGFVVEIHWDLTTPDSAFRFDLDELRSRTQILNLNQTTMRVLAPIDHLLHIVTQCTEGGFCEMRRVIDAALLLRAIDDMDELGRRAQKQNQGAALWVLLDQVGRWTGMDVPKDLVKHLVPGAKTARLLTELANRMLRGKGEFRRYSEIHHILQWGCMPTAALRRKTLCRFLSPGQEHWLELGHSPQNMPGLSERLKLRLLRITTLFYLIKTAVTAVKD